MISTGSARTDTAIDRFDTYILNRDSDSCSLCSSSRQDCSDYILTGETSDIKPEIFRSPERRRSEGEQCSRV